MSTETKAHVPVTGWTEGVWYHEGLSAYVLIRAGWKKGSGVFKNRITVSVMGDKSVPADELENTAERIAEAFNVATETGLTPRQLAERVETLKREAQIHAMEARTAKATIAEIYQLCTGGTGEPGNWNGAEPVRQLAEQRAGLVQAARRAEVAFNTVRYCYERDPGNFMLAMKELDQDVEALRAILAKETQT